MLRYASSTLFGLLTVFTVLVVLQSFVVGRQFQSNALNNGNDNSSVVNLGNQAALGNSIAVLPDKPGTLHAPPLPEQVALARVQPPEIPAPAMALPGFKPPFTAVAAEALPAETAPVATAPANTPQAQPVLAVGDLVLMERVEPKFPTQAAREGITSGEVTVRFTVQPDGTVTDTSVIAAKPRRGIFDDAAMRAVLRWKFKPISAPRDTSVIISFSQDSG